ncbi:MAG: GNAT family N-acetyltransferase [Candidatus Micrarchaeia archaeon]
MIIQRTTTPIKSQGSIGASWPPTVDRVNSRLKGFIPFILNKNNTEGILREVQREGELQNVSRITIRALSNNNSIKELNSIAEVNGFELEAQIPLGPRYSDTSILYFARNSNQRRVNEDIRHIQREIIENTQLKNPKTREELVRILTSNGYTQDSNINTGNGDMQRLVNLYSQCLPVYLMDLNRENIKEMIENEDNQTLVIRNNGLIISAAIAEHAIINIEGLILPLVELSECATDPNYRGQGLLSAILSTLISMQEEGSIIYSEARAGHLPINVALRNNSLDYQGTLNKHCVIGESVQNPIEGLGPFSNMENLNVWSGIVG